MFFKDGNVFVDDKDPAYLERERKEIERELERLIERAKKKKLIKKEKIIVVVREFISRVNSTLGKLERGKEGLKIKEVIMLHKVYEYYIFVRGIDYRELLPELWALRERAEKWVEQDEYNLERIFMDAKIIRRSISSHTNDLGYISVLKEKPYGLPMWIYLEDPKRIPNKAVIVLHGFLGDRGAMDLLCSRIAHQGYMACSFELPGHYLKEHMKPEDEFRVGLTCEYIYHAVEFVRKRYNVKRVAVIGHSIGAVASLFSLGYYNREIEDKIYGLFDSYSSILEKLRSDKSNPLIDELESLYIQIKSLIFNALRWTRFEVGRIDAVIAISPPRKFQVDFSPSMARTILKFKRLLGTRQKHPKTGKFAYKLGSFRTYEIEKFVEYVINVKNPLDYMNLIEFFSNLAERGRMNLIKYYRIKYILDTPKLLLYGKYLDIMNRLIFPTQFREYEGVYSSWNMDIKSYPFKGHWLCHGFGALKGKAATSSKVVTDIIKFLEEKL